MRIDAYNAVSQIYAANKPVKTTSAAKTSRKDEVQISSFGKDIQTLKQAIANTSDIREDVTAPLKASVQAGTYNVSDNDFASKLLSKYEEKYGSI